MADDKPEADADLPTFLIPVGTQVVLTTARHGADGAVVKPAGSVAEVLETPISNRKPYVLRFLDGIVLRARFGELSVRSREVSQVGAGLPRPYGTPGVDLRQYVILRVAAGSRAFGLSVETSDDDRRGVYLPPAEMTWSLFKPPEQIEYKADGVEEVCWELEKYLLLALQANPNILETLWSPGVLFADETGHALRGLRSAFLSRHLYKTYSGYVLSQFRLMKRSVERTGAYRAKHAMHLIRLLYSGIHALRHGDVLVDVGGRREELLRIRGGGLTFDEVSRRALELDREFQETFQSTRLPDRPDYDRVNRFLVRARRSRVDDARPQRPE